MNLLLALLIASVPESGSQTQRLVQFVSDVCLAQDDRVSAATRFVPSSWQILRQETQRDVDFSVDAAVPLHDRLEQSWQGLTEGGGRIRLIVRSLDYRDPQRRDYSFAMFNIYPSRLVDLEEFHRQTGLVIRPADAPENGRESDVTLAADGRVLAVANHRVRRPVQHYRLNPHGAGNVEIRARHIDDGEFPEQLFSISCATRL